MRAFYFFFPREKLQFHEFQGDLWWPTNFYFLQDNYFDKNFYTML